MTVVYKNRYARRFRNENLEETVLIQSLSLPPQGVEYVPLRGELFPDKFPVAYSDIYDGSYFWLKYYLTQYMFFTFAKRPHYVNYEVLINAFNTRNIDLSQARIIQID